MKKKIHKNPFFIRLFHWEYWPFHVVYSVLYFYWFWLCLKARSFFFFSSANPSLKNGGFLMESKKDIYDIMQEGTYPETIFARAGTDPLLVWHEIKYRNLTFPLVGKPDIGLRGMNVKKLDDREALLKYLSASKVDILIQQFVPFEMEAGIFYYRMPGEQNGNISGIVLKEFLSVTGDGKSTTLDLLEKDSRFVLQLPALKKEYGRKLNEILSDGEKKLLVPYGNHSRGAKFIDASDLIDKELVAAIDAVCSKIDGFYYGRMDIRFKSWEELKQGKNFSIIELNGAGSEPTHIYDPKHSIFFAWREITRHWNLLYKISKMNRKKSPHMNFNSGIRMFRENFAYLKLLNPDT